MSEEMESVKIRSVTMAVIREWAEASGRTVSGLASELLDEAARHYMDGTKQRRSAVKAVLCPECQGPTIPETADRVPYDLTGKRLCINRFCPQEPFYAQAKPNLMDAPNHFDGEVSQ